MDRIRLTVAILSSLAPPRRSQGEPQRGDLSSAEALVTRCYKSMWVSEHPRTLTCTILYVTCDTEHVPETFAQAWDACRGIYICNWQAADATSRLAGTIIEDLTRCCPLLLILLSCWFMLPGLRAPSEPTPPFFLRRSACFPLYTPSPERSPNPNPNPKPNPKSKSNSNPNPKSFPSPHPLFFFKRIVCFRFYTPSPEPSLNPNPNPKVLRPHLPYTRIACFRFYTPSPEPNPNPNPKSSPPCLFLDFPCFCLCTILSELNLNPKPKPKSNPKPYLQPSCLPPPCSTAVGPFHKESTHTHNYTHLHPY